MLFTSINFLLLVLITFVLYYTLPKRMQWGILLIASYIFYFIAGPSFLPFIAITTVSAHILGIQISKVQEEQKQYLLENKSSLSKEEKKAYKVANKNKQKKYMLIAVLINLGILAVLKYTNFVIYNVNEVSKVFGGEGALSFANMIIPLGISFYTFQTLSYIMDVYNNRHGAEKNLGKFALFVSFFPQLVQGPISRYGDLSQTLCQEHQWDSKNISFGMQRILWGYFKKMVIADRALIAVKTLIENPDEYTGFYVFVGMMLYALQLYADFSGGIDITIGIAQIFGIRLKENFIRPYFSKSIKEYWNRWHITMGSWFTDYVFYPVSISKPMRTISKKSRVRLGDKIGKRVPVYLAAIIVWFTTGIWHGASWNFIVWGLANCAVILVSQELEPLYKRFHDRFDVNGKTAFRIFQVIRTVLLMSAIRTFDCYRDVPLTFKMFGTMFTEWNMVEVLSVGIFNLGLSVSDYVVLAIGTLTLLFVSLKQRSAEVRKTLHIKPYIVQYLIFLGMFLAIMVFGVYGIGFEQSQFIYNQF